MSNSTGGSGTVSLGGFEISATAAAVLSFLSSFCLVIIYIIRKLAKISYSKEKGLTIEPGLASSPEAGLDILKIDTTNKK